MKRTLTLLFGLCLAALGHAADPELVIAGHGASLEQALAAPHAPSYRLLVLRKELMRVRASRAEEEVRQLIERARAGGAVVFVCEKDLRAEQCRSQAEKHLLLRAHYRAGMPPARACRV